MALDPDPYRTLGLKRGATLDEVRRAYRRLAKVNHPDAAGETALPRFLAIQAAYEQIAGSGRGPPRSVPPRPRPPRSRSGAGAGCPPALGRRPGPRPSHASRGAQIRIERGHP